MPNNRETLSRGRIVGDLFVQYGPDNASRLQVFRQQGENDCGHALLRSLGYPGYEFKSAEEAITGEDIIALTGAQDVTEEAFKDGYAYEGPHIVLGIKKSTGNPHWFGRVGNIVFDTEIGDAFAASEYMRKHIDDVWCVLKIPQSSGNNGILTNGKVGMEK